MKIALGLLLFYVAVISLPWWCIAADGNRLLADCGAAVTAIDTGQTITTEKLVDVTRCFAWLEGMLQMNDLYEFKGATAVFCRPNNSTNVQLVRIVVKYLQDHPEELHKDEFVLAIALRTAFPCTDKK